MSSSTHLGVTELPSSPRIEYTAYPHIIESILALSDRATLLRLRATCKALMAQAHRALHTGRLLIEVEGSFIDRRSLSPEYEADYPHYPASWAPKTPAVVMRSGRGALPFRSEEEWTWACARSSAVEIDSAALAASSCVAPHATRGFAVREFDNPDEFGLEARKASSVFPSRPVPSTPDSVGMQASLLRALGHVPRSAVVTIDHSGRNGAQGTPAWLPPVDSLVFLLNPRCNCLLFEGGAGPNGLLPPTHSAKHITLRVPPERKYSDSEGTTGSGNESSGVDSDESEDMRGSLCESWGDSDSDSDFKTCQLTCTLVRLSLERLTFSVDLYIEDLRLIKYDYVLTDLMCFRDSAKALRTFDIELRQRSIPDHPAPDAERKQELAERMLRTECAAFFAFDAGMVNISYSDEAGLRRLW